ncbi:MAG: hypothetical protein JO147_10975 [Actinobacteria bacterium]|nr:hypothetical protein [Actinomycetota bacterium]
MTAYGSLDWARVTAASVAPPVWQAISGWPRGGEVRAAAIDADLADTAAFCDRYGVGLEHSANCVIIAGRRGDVVRYAACVVLATTRADVNGAIRRLLDARKSSFAPMDVAVSLTGMEFGGITPIGVPADWPVLIDRAVHDTSSIVIGAGVRRSKLSLPGAALADLPGARVIDELAR